MRSNARSRAKSLAQVFGWQLLQIGQWGDDDGLLSEARTQRKIGVGVAWLASARRRVGDSFAHRFVGDRSPTRSMRFCCRTRLEYEPEPHEIVREVGRILSAEGHLIVFGFRPFSSWGLRHCSRRAGSRRAWSA